MQITKFQLSNYKSFNEPVRLEFSNGINVITGQNSAGKTALLEALSLRFSAIAHRSLKTVPTRDSTPNRTTKIEASFQLSRAEVAEVIMRLRGSGLNIPKPTLGTSFSEKINYHAHDAASSENLVRWFMACETHTFQLLFEQNEADSGIWTASRVPSFGNYQAEKQGDAFLYCQATVGSGPGIELRPLHQIAGSPRNELGAQLGPQIAQRIYIFRAERPRVGSCPFGGSSQLAPDASNLAEVLNTLDQNKVRFNRFDQQVSRILPQIRQVAVRPSQYKSGDVEIVVWPHDPASEREDLAIPLANCGTGVGQVLAILYVVLTADSPQIIVIDEPQSFLHPGAARKLIQTLKDHPEHQYVIATHSPTIISAASPEKVIMITLRDGESKAEMLDAAETATQRLLLLEVGATLSDVFGADNVLWVEGATEEVCFPEILEKLVGHGKTDTVIKGVVATGDFESRRHRHRQAELVLEIYERLSKSTSLIPPAIGFLFDTDGRTAKEQEDLRRRAKGRLHFLTRRMFENFLLVPTAIAVVMNSEESFPTKPVSEELVRSKLEVLLKEPKYYESGAKQSLVTVHGGRLLEDLFGDMSAGTIVYRKTKHSVALTDWLVENSPDELADITGLLRKILVSPPD